MQLSLVGIPEHRLILAQSPLSNDESLNQIYQLGVSFTNSSPHTVIGYTVEWVRIDASGNRQLSFRTSVDLGLLRSGYQVRSKRSPNLFGSAVVPSGVTRVLLPISGGANLTSPIPILALNHAVTTYGQADSITVALDSVLFDDGTLVGPDTSKSINRFQAAIDAEQDILKQVLQCKLNSSAPSDFLSQQAGKAFPTQIVTANEWYAFFAIQESKSLTRRLKVLGADSTLQYASAKVFNVKPVVRHLD